MAISGTVFAGFVLFHLAGNLKIFLGRDDFNHYAEWLRTLGNPLLPGETTLWILRIVLFVCLVAHILSGVILRLRGRKVRGKFRRKGLKGLSNFRTRYMLVTGILLFCFLIFHLLDLTFHVAPFGVAAATPADHLIGSFQRPGVAIFYMAIMILLFLHLGHGLVSVVYDLGSTGKRFRAVWLALAGVVALVVALGNILLPFCVLIGVIK